MKVSFNLPNDRQIIVHNVSDFKAESEGRTRLFMNTYEEVTIVGELLEAVDKQRVPTEDQDIEKLDLADTVFDGATQLRESDSPYVNFPAE